MTAVDNLISLDLLPRLSGRLWDTSRILPDSGAFGGTISALTGYRARPDLTQLVALALYWSAMAWTLLRQERWTP